MVKKCNKSNDLIATASKLKLTKIEPGATAEEIVNFTGLDIVREAGDKKGVNMALFIGNLN